MKIRLQLGHRREDTLGLINAPVSNFLLSGIRVWKLKEIVRSGAWDGASGAAAKIGNWVIVGLKTRIRNQDKNCGYGWSVGERCEFEALVEGRVGEGENVGEGEG